ncbi:hypothetical protein HC776_03115, partial [bacterium]|nr:hypothetical protein [bacterium]
MSEGGEQKAPETAPTSEPSRQSPFPSADANWWEGGQKVKPGEEFQTRKLNTQLDKMTRRSAGRRSTTITDRKRGRYIRAVPPAIKRTILPLMPRCGPPRRTSSPVRNRSR